MIILLHGIRSKAMDYIISWSVRVQDFLFKVFRASLLLGPFFCFPDAPPANKVWSQNCAKFSAKITCMTSLQWGAPLSRKLRRVQSLIFINIWLTFVLHHLKSEQELWDDFYRPSRHACSMVSQRHGFWESTPPPAFDSVAKDMSLNRGATQCTLGRRPYIISSFLL